VTLLLCVQFRGITSNSSCYGGNVFKPHTTDCLGRTATVTLLRRTELACTYVDTTTSGRGCGSGAWSCLPCREDEQTPGMSLGPCSNRIDSADIREGHVDAQTIYRVIIAQHHYQVFGDQLLRTRSQVPTWHQTPR
jgi:hypothetical protein